MRKDGRTEEGERRSGEDRGVRDGGEREKREELWILPTYLAEICLCVHVLLCTKVQLCCHDDRVNTIQSILCLLRNHRQSMAHRLRARYKDKVGIVLSSALWPEK